MARWARYALAIAALAVAGGVAVAWSGIVSVAASSGHWTVTEWVLHSAMRRSVATHAMGIEPPPLDDRRLVRRGASHYAGGCAPCHGAPGQGRSAVVRRMTPAPPALIERIGTWSSGELFWIVRHGVKFTGMPAWPAGQRADEVWAVVAFLNEMPRMDGATYRRFAFGEANARAAEPGGPTGGPFAVLSPASAAGCARCHGADGGTDGGAFPRLAGQSEDYLYATLRAFADGTRFSGIMQAAVAGLDDGMLRTLARHYAAAKTEDRSPRATRGEAGERLARQGAPDRGIPPCASCHGLAEGARHSRYPSLAGQPADYIVSQLTLFRDEARGGTSYAHIMRTIAQRLDPAQREAVARFYEMLGRSAAAER